ncbi:autotransporter outer membrane beta-barrel domain-containing protein [Trabulsiella odontotermitis]|uniref:autotransporter outer membrane beta-barrel domain-containing protein n=1 Tax=Trabulsiella odontotermitis TaxID=379893 RepID=UPI0023782274|nr:autotransporter outer membrane beta-barrel domain-containing protein [Trabulsiella odontotermitis]
MFSHSLKDREGRAEDSSLWLRQLAFRSHANDDSGQLQMRGNSYVIQGGGEVWNGQFGEQDRLGVGIMAGYGYSSGNTHSAKTHYDAKNSVHGYSAGAYATWYQNAKSVNGLYVDSWLQYSWLRASVNGEGLVGESYDIRGLSGSLESGYRHPLSPRVFITPQAQAIWSGGPATRK